ncbi:MAG: aspartate--tRNA ligase [Abditibacteriales bacterium]|nr:aspartate--tRNA ligase [Abditibacteriales bacterium]
MKRTHVCGELRAEHVGQEVVVTGWVQRTRDHGGVIFIDLRDRSGVVQTVFDPARASGGVHERASQVRNEFVLAVQGRVAKRPAGTENPRLATGEIEIVATEMEVLNPAKPTPFLISDEADKVDESVRLTYRYLDLRRPRMRNILELRHRVTKAVRDFMDGEGFWEVETPNLWKSTPEGAREYVVPSRLHAGRFYVLPQSPQLCKQLLMVAGVEKYFQIARCFRDEDTRADRQPEFTQIDIEMSFVEQEDILSLVERMYAYVFKRVMGIEIATPFPRLRYAEALARYGTDKPDTRFGMELVDLSDIVKDSGFRVFQQTVASGGQVKAICAPGCAGYSRKEVEDLTKWVQQFGAKGLATFALGESEIRSQVAKFLTAEQMEEIFRRCGAKTGDLVLCVADQPDVVADALGRLRLEMGRRLGLIPKGQYNFLWIVDVPLFGWNAAEQRYDPMHHPFCAPLPEDLELLKAGYTATVPPGHPDHPWGKVRANLYDCVLNGYEVAGGSIRTHRRDVQELVFGAIGLDFEQAKERFGFLLEAFEYGAPPHGGIACGLERLIMILAGTDNIRDVIAFPKTGDARDLMTGAPTVIDDQTLAELHVRTIPSEE